MEGKGGKQLIVMLAQMESYLHPRFAFGGMAGEELKERSNMDGRGDQKVTA